MFLSRHAIDIVILVYYFHWRSCVERKGGGVEEGRQLQANRYKLIELFFQGLLKYLTLPWPFVVARRRTASWLILLLLSCSLGSRRTHTAHTQTRTHTQLTLLGHIHLCETFGISVFMAHAALLHKSLTM